MTLTNDAPKSVYISGFHKILPPHKIGQEELMRWMADLKIVCEAKNKGLSESETEAVRAEIDANRAKVAVGLGPKNIRFRYSFVKDFVEPDEHKRLIYNSNDNEGGCSTTLTRSTEFLQITEQLFEEFYENVTQPPENIIHTTCTGYFYPNAAQRLILKKGWYADTTSTNAYHMGCHASIPTIRMANGFVRSGKGTVDCVHTEICLLHIKSLQHSLSNMVIDGLFADGAIKYTLSYSEQPPAAGFELLATHEIIVPGSLDQMYWAVADCGFEMELSKDVALHVIPFIDEVLATLKSKANISAEEDLSNAIYAIHPGGPTIVDQLATHLKLELFQYKYSVMVLSARGNMSSATIPHIWQEIMKDARVASGTLVFTMAFGPGLTIATAVLRKL